MSCNNYKELKEHVGHEIVCVRYGDPVENVALECETCNKALQILLTTYAKAGPATYDGKLVHSDAGCDLAVVKILGDSYIPA